MIRGLGLLVVGKYIWRLGFGYKLVNFIYYLGIIGFYV